MKDVQKWVHGKLVENPMKKKHWISITSKDRSSKLGNPKNKRATKP
jgi:hypothetical protein